MKNHNRALRIFLTLTIFLIAGNAGAQSVTIGTISGSQFCAGDSISVTFTATGFWGHRNAFTLQLSDPTGSFSNSFQSISSLFDTLPGTFTINSSIPGVGSSTHYRFRILAAVPYITSADNGSDISIGTGTWPGVGYGTLTAAGHHTQDAGSPGTPLAFYVEAATPDPNTISSNSIFWDFGSGATPANGTFDVGTEQSVVYSTVTYSTPGHKITTLTSAGTGGCSSTNTYELDIYDCSVPVIPHDAIVINSDTGVVDPGRTYWVNPGFTLSLNTTGMPKKNTVFAEPGSTVIGELGSLFYMKPGSVFSSSRGGNWVIFGDGASINTNSDDFTLNCPTLDFDYSNAPPNAIQPLSVKNDLKSVSITVSPNPTGGILSVQGLPSDNVTVSVFNTLGETVMVQKNPSAPDFTLDLSKLAPGTYYLRFSSANSVVTKKVVRE